MILSLNILFELLNRLFEWTYGKSDFLYAVETLVTIDRLLSRRELETRYAFRSELAGFLPPGARLYAYFPLPD